jgi:hypothetical protein
MAAQHRDTFFFWMPFGFGSDGRSDMFIVITCLAGTVYEYISPLAGQGSQKTLNGLCCIKRILLSSRIAITCEMFRGIPFFAVIGHVESSYHILSDNDNHCLPCCWKLLIHFISEDVM